LQWMQSRTGILIRLVLRSMSRALTEMEKWEL
jgi:hypothetical protein